MNEPQFPTRCSVIIVSYNVAEMLLQCLHSVYASAALADFALALEVIVVDSASSDDTPQRVAVAFPQVCLLPQQENIGFTRGNNVGIRAATGDLLFLLNPDTVLLADALPTLVRHLADHPQVGIVGPHTHNSDLSHQPTRRRFPDRATAFLESTWLQPFAPRRVLERFMMADIAPDSTHDVEWMQGSALLVRRAVVDQIGLLDEGYTMYSEELDFCQRAHAAGWRLVFCAEAHIIHHGGASSGQVGALKHIWFQTSKLRYHRRVHGKGFAAVLRAFLLASYAAQIGIEGLKSMLGSQRPMRQQRIRTYWQVLRSGLCPNP